MSLTVDSIEEDGAVFLDCADDMNALEMSGDFEELDKMLGKQWSSLKVALGMSRADYIDSAVIGWLLSLHKRFNESGGKLVLHSMNPSIERVLKLMRIDNVLNLAENRAEAKTQLMEDA
ncbi:MAG: STAS domain-containing protein [Phycisphaeraceae bacterium]